MDKHLDSLRAGVGAVWLVEGAAGLGKSRLDALFGGPSPPLRRGKVTTTHFVVTSVNGADDYFINWIAVPIP